MDFLTERTGKLFRHFLVASIMGCLVSSIYSFVDTIAVGQSEGALGSASMAIIAPLYGITMIIPILCGVGGAVLMSNARGEGNEEKGNAYFTSSVILISILTAAFWIIFALFHDPIFRFFGADDVVLEKVMEYAKWVIRFFPFFITPTFFGTFVRNDGAPNLVMTAVIIGGAINIFLDWYLVFPLGMGMEGAALATVVGMVVQSAIMAIHFFRKSCRLRLVRPHDMLKGMRKIVTIGVGGGIVDFGLVWIIILTNKQIGKYGSTEHLAVYGVLTTIITLLQSMFCGVGQAVQPMISANYGAKQHERVRSFWKMSLTAVITMGIVFTALGEFFPTQIIRIFMDVTPQVLEVAPTIIRIFFLMFLFLGLSVNCIYYLQSIMHGKMSMLLASLKSIIVSSLLLIVLPMLIGVNGIWLAFSITELLVSVTGLIYIKLKMK